MKKDLPYSIDIEQAILGTILYNYNKIKKDIDLLKPSYFYKPEHKIIIRAIFKLHDNHKNVDATVVKDYLRKNNKLKDIGGLSFLGELENQPYYTDNFENYINKLKDYYKKRRFIINADKAIDKAYGDNNIEDIKNDLSHNLYSFETKSDVVGKGGIIDFRKKTLIDKINRVKVGCGYQSLDKFLSNGFAKRNTSVITGRPRMGKSSLKDNFIINQLSQDISVLVISTEMTAEGELDRLTSIKSGIPIYDILNAKEWMEEEDSKIKTKYPKKLKQIKKASKWLNNKDFYLTDGVASLSKIKSTIARYKDMYDIDIVYIDLVDRIKEIFYATSNKAPHIAKVVGELTQSAKSHDVHMCLVAQQRRESNRKTIPKPTLRGIKGSGAYEEFTDLIFGVHREYIADDDMMEDNIIEVIILKQRQGKTAVNQEFEWDGSTIKIFEQKGNL